MDAETEQYILSITIEELNNLISKLYDIEMIQYISFDTLEITDTGIRHQSRE